MVPSPLILMKQQKLLLDDVQYQLTNNIYAIDELAARFHHRLVSIHVFPNGNGRHARLYIDTFLMSNGSEKFSWGMLSLAESSYIRKSYINALRAADRGRYDLLYDFVRG